MSFTQAICICPQCKQQKWCYAARKPGEPEPVCYICKLANERKAKR